LAVHLQKQYRAQVSPIWIGSANRAECLCVMSDRNHVPGKQHSKRKTNEGNENLVEKTNTRHSPRTNEAEKQEPSALSLTEIDEEKAQYLAHLIREGQMTARRAVALSMKNEQYPLTVISKITGLSEEEIDGIS